MRTPAIAPAITGNWRAVGVAYIGTKTIAPSNPSAHAIISGSFDDAIAPTAARANGGGSMLARSISAGYTTPRLTDAAFVSRRVERAL